MEKRKALEIIRKFTYKFRSETKEYEEVAHALRRIEMVVEGIGQDDDESNRR